MTILDHCCCVCEGQRCRAIFRNKCCIFCLIFLALLIAIVIGAKVYITAILNEVEEESFDMTFHGLIDGTNDTAEHLLASWQVPEAIRKEVSCILSGFDFFNRPVWILPFGQWNLKGLLNSNEDIERELKIYMDFFIYQIQRSMATKNVSDWILICDMEGYSYSQLASFSTIGFLIRMTKKIQPMLELLAYGYVLNLDYFSNTFINMMRPILGSIMDKFETTGSDKDKYISSMLKKIPANQLPQQYGGSKGHIPVAVY